MCFIFNTDTINFINLKLLEGQIDLILEALELYAFNLHRVYVIDKDSSLEDLRNSLLYYTYELILSQYTEHRIDYNVLKECSLNLQRKKRKIYYKKVA